MIEGFRAMSPLPVATSLLLLAVLWALPAEAGPRRRVGPRTVHRVAAREATPPAALARQHAESARILFELQEYDGAVDEWKEAYRLKPAPLLLFNIAQAARMSGRLTEARRAYVRYLESVDAGNVPKNGPARSEVVLRIAELDAKVPAGATGSPRRPQTSAVPDAPSAPTIVTPRPSAADTPEGLGVSADLLVPDLRAPVTASPARPSTQREVPPLPAYTPPMRPAQVVAVSFGVVAAGLGIAAAFQQFEAGTIWGDAESAGKTGDELLYARQQGSDAQGKAAWMLTGALASAAVAGGVWWWNREPAP